MKRESIIMAVLIVLQLCSSLWALPTTLYEAEMVVTGWLKADNKPLGMSLGQQIITVEPFTDDYGEPVYYIVYLNPSGFVIVSADDLVEPIIGFVNDSTYDPSLSNPLGALVTKDLNGRIASVRGTISLMAKTPQAAATETQKKWNYFIRLAETSNKGFQLMSTDPLYDSNLPSDVRVAPFVKSKWSQSNCYERRYDNAEGWYTYECACYNYYTPPYRDGNSNNYFSGCVATTIAQLMHYYKYPNEPNDIDSSQPDGRKRFAIEVDGVEQTAFLRGGNGNGGPYKWDFMPYEPNCSTTEAQRQAIGALCYDAGVSVNMEYSEGGSFASLQKAVEVLKNVFKYSNGIKGRNYDYDREIFLNIGSGLIGMINPNLDAQKPVILGIRGKDTRDDSDAGHAIICDGYGYGYDNNTSTPYHHLNMGWSGSADCWYNLPDIDCNACSEQSYKFSVVESCGYNIFKKSDTGEDIKGEIISGRVTDSLGNNPISGATVTAHPHLVAVVPMRATPATTDDLPILIKSYSSVTNSNGIYALVGVNSGSTYTVSVKKTGYNFTPPNQVVTTGTSTDYNDVSGNKWGIDFEDVLDVQPTFRPVSATQCPRVNTQCPVELTKCPTNFTSCSLQPTLCGLGIDTQCPPSATKCPPTNTRCPSVNTQCPVESTKCPINLTSCPPQPTICLTIVTECPSSYTQCPPEETECPTSDTQCPPSDTHCPAWYSLCPPHSTICAFIDTECPPWNTICTHSDTECPTVDTQCPVESTKCPVVMTMCADTVCPTVSTSCPAWTTWCPPEETECPTVDTQCPPESTKCPTNYTSCPLQPTTCIIIGTECPLATFCPHEDTSCPPVRTSCPVKPTMCLVTVCDPNPTSCPVVMTWCPLVSTSCPGIPPCYSSGSGNSVGEMRNLLSAGLCPAIEAPCPSVVTK